jgi:hypothetical protein
LLFESAIFAFESAITLTAESAIILGESIFWEWRLLVSLSKSYRNEIGSKHSCKLSTIYEIH